MQGLGRPIVSWADHNYRMVCVGKEVRWSTNWKTAYRRSPSTFFGVIKEGPAQINEPMDAYDFFWGSYGENSKERLLELTKDWPDAASLRNLDQRRLAQVYCARYAEHMWRQKLQASPSSKGKAS